MHKQFNSTSNITLKHLKWKLAATFALHVISNEHLHVMLNLANIRSLIKHAPIKGVFSLTTTWWKHHTHNAFTLPYGQVYLFQVCMAHALCMPLSPRLHLTLSVAILSGSRCYCHGALHGGGCTHTYHKVTALLHCSRSLSDMVKNRSGGFVWMTATVLLLLPDDISQLVSAAANCLTPMQFCMKIAEGIVAYYN